MRDLFKAGILSGHLKKLKSVSNPIRTFASWVFCSIPSLQSPNREFHKGSRVIFPRFLPAFQPLFEVLFPHANGLIPQSKMGESCCGYHSRFSGLRDELSFRFLDNFIARHLTPFESLGSSFPMNLMKSVRLSIQRIEAVEAEFAENSLQTPLWFYLE